MPIYEFACATCSNDWEEIRSFRDPIPAACPNCGAGTVEKKISLSSFHLKGSGWYQSDFKDNGRSSEPTQTCQDAPSCAQAGSCAAAGDGKQAANG